jgi:hypothetical protein
MGNRMRKAVAEAMARRITRRRRNPAISRKAAASMAATTTVAANMVAVTTAAAITAVAITDQRLLIDAGIERRADRGPRRISELT